MVTSNPNQNDLNLDGQKAAGDVTKAWTQLLGARGAEVHAYDIATSVDNSIYIVGETNRDLHGISNNGNVDGFLSKYGPDGNREWTTLFGDWRLEEAYAVTTSSDGSIYISGYAERVGNNRAFLSKYNEQGENQWTSYYQSDFGRLGSPMRDNDLSGYALTTDKDGSVYTTSVVVKDTGGDVAGIYAFNAYKGSSRSLRKHKFLPAQGLEGINIGGLKA